MGSHKVSQFFLIDGSSYIYRAFWAIRNLATSRGFPTNAIYGFTSMILKVLKDFQPDYLAIAFDAKGPTFREEIYPDYKANRPEMSNDLIVQLPYIKKIVEAFNIPTLEVAGYEADDIIGTLARQAEKKGFQIVIITGDKDMMQLVSDKITLFDTMKGEKITVEEVKKRFGILPKELPDLFGLMGDASDNIPGVPGIGEKTAIELIKEFHSLENLLNSLEKVKKEKLRQNLQKFAQQARLSRELATINTQVPLKTNLEEFLFTGRQPDREKLREIFMELEFSKFLKELTPVKKISYQDYHIILSKKELETCLENLAKAKEFAIDLETTSKDPMRSEIVGIALSFKPHQAFYIPVGHDYSGAPCQLSCQEVLEALKPFLESPIIQKIGCNIKYDMIVLSRYGINLAEPISDVMIAAYLLNPAKHNHNLEEICRDYLGHQKITYHEVVGTGKKEIPFNKVPLEKAKIYSAEDADVTLLVNQILLPKLRENNLVDLYETLEIPLIRVLHTMEANGIKIDTDFLEKLSVDFSSRLDKIKRAIFNSVGEEFNLDSPKQLQVILYEKLALQRGKKIKTGYSTDSDTLTRLALEHEVPAKILEYRMLTKLKNTYIDALPMLVNPRTGRIHTSYNQTVTATGRLSSSEPNLQNIPIRTEEGRKIRQAFIPEEGYIFVSADYSQIELRLLAHFSRDERLIEAFRNNEDIHTYTATEIFGVPSDLVSLEMRRFAKTINFGIIYGMSAYGLSQELNISCSMAQEYIQNYFERYPGVRRYIEDTLREARENGYVETLFKRRRPLPELASSNGAIRQFAERAAINTPLQGSAADIMKKAMIELHSELRTNKFKTKMVLQVHDELLFEVPRSEVKKIVELIREKMENIVKLAVPLKVDLRKGSNWLELEAI